MNRLTLRAGKEAYEKIKKDGLTPEMVTGVVAAAGGPKWFTTYGLVRYIIGEFLEDAHHPLHFLGASVGSWQMTAAMTSHPMRAIDRLQQAYSTTIYSDKPDEKEISLACQKMIEHVILDESEHILSHPSRCLQVVTARGRGLLSHSNQVLRGLGFGAAFISNIVGRRYMAMAADRVVFKTKGDLMFQSEKDILPTKEVDLTADNLVPALRASGTIPYMMDAINDIPAAPRGYYWDGGMTDYHISLPYRGDGIVLHPHFLNKVLPGWFDKKLPWNRSAHESLMSKVLLITPSEAYIESLPRKQISDMKDFKHFGQAQDRRIAYWSEISSRSLELGEELSDLIRSGQIVDRIEPYTR